MPLRLFSRAVYAGICGVVLCMRLESERMCPMKKCLLIVFLLCALPLFAAEENEILIFPEPGCDVGNLKWGMTVEEVQARLGGKLEEDKPFTVEELKELNRKILGDLGYSELELSAEYYAQLDKMREEYSKIGYRQSLGTLNGKLFNQKAESHYGFFDGRLVVVGVRVSFERNERGRRDALSRILVAQLHEKIGQEIKLVSYHY